MRAGKPSATAIGAAAFRAAHLQLFDGAPIHADTFALPLMGLPGRSELQNFIERVAAPATRRVSAYFALRHRYSEERLHAALAHGVTQVVLLGAGLDLGPEDAAAYYVAQPPEVTPLHAWQPMAAVV
jgi:O-methyltransferase involved in polyketide biosynthesis